MNRLLYINDTEEELDEHYHKLTQLILEWYDFISKKSDILNEIYK